MTTRLKPVAIEPRLRLYEIESDDALSEVVAENAGCQLRITILDRFVDLADGYSRSKLYLEITVGKRRFMLRQQELARLLDDTLDCIRAELLRS